MQIPASPQPVARSRLRRKAHQRDLSQLTAPKPPNVSEGERILSFVAGGALLLFGLRRYSTLSGTLANGTGLALMLRGGTGRCPAYQALGIDTTPQGKADHLGLLDPHPYALQRSITIHRPLPEVFQKARNWDVAKSYVVGLVKVQMMNPKQARWIFSDAEKKVYIPVDIELVDVIDSSLIAWRILPGARFGLTGSIHFRPSPEAMGTEVSVVLQVLPPAGAIGAFWMKALSPLTQTLLSQTLHRFKQWIETGEVATTDGQSSGRPKPTLISGAKKIGRKIRLQTLKIVVERT